MCITLSIFGIFALYAIHEVRWLENFQTNVVQKNRLASLQLLRLQDNTYFLAISLRDMTLPESRYPIGYWRGEYGRVRQDMDQALALEAQYAATTPAGDEKRAQLRDLLADFWLTTDEAFTLADTGHEETARYLIRSELESKREVISRVIGGLLTLNDQAQAEAGRRINAVYGKVKRDILLVIGVLFLVALGTGLYTLQANRKTFERLHQLAGRLQVQNQQLAALYDAINAVSQEQEPRKVLQDTCEQLSRALGVARVLFLRCQPETARLLPQAACGLTMEEAEEGRWGEALAGSMAALETGQPVTARLPAPATEFLALPLRVGPALNGVFALVREPGAAPPGDDDLRLAAQLVAATVGPLKNAQLLERLRAQSEQLRKLSWKLIEVQEETLRHVARDLHDEFGQILTAIGVMLGRAGQKGLDKDSLFVQDVQKVKKIVEDTLQTVRDTSQILRPAILDDFGLEQTLEWFVGQFIRQTGIQVHFEREMMDNFFPGEEGIHIYRIVQEALNNVARHSKADEAWVIVRESQGEMRLEVRDNGAGFDLQGEMDRAAGEGLGLMGMRERVEHLNGTFSIESAPGKGTTVRARVPLRHPTPRPAAERVT
ncbi:MAG: GAF domain-containing sensor histidine kinase [Acidobacteriia bacterium]|nr:GAF domain-containing sensor histidine kinase [Terriglobia bacterium]